MTIPTVLCATWVTYIHSTLLYYVWCILHACILLFSPYAHIRARITKKDDFSIIYIFSLSFMVCYWIYRKWKLLFFLKLLIFWNYVFWWQLCKFSSVNGENGFFNKIPFSETHLLIAISISQWYLLWLQKFTDPVIIVTIKLVNYQGISRVNRFQQSS